MLSSNEPKYVGDHASRTPYSNVISMSIATVLFLTVMYFLTEIDNDKSGMKRLGLLMVIQLTPAFIIFARRQFNYLAFVLLNHFISYSFAKYNVISNIEKSGQVSPTALLAIQEMTYCTFLIVVSYYFCRYFIFQRVARREQFQMFSLSKEQFVWTSIYLMSQPILFLYLPDSLRAINAAASGMAIILIFCAETGSPATERWIKLGVFGISIASFLMQGSLAFFVGVSTVFFIVCFIQWRTQNFVLIVMIAILGTLIQTVKGQYRFILRSQSMNLVEQAQTLGTLLAMKYTDYEPDEEEDSLILASTLEEEEIGDSVARGFGRVGDDSLERVLAYTPARVPFWEGETYAHIPFIFIPRLIWPDKPKRDMWNKFGRLYEFLSDGDENTSVGVNFLGEAYMNFGYVGLYSVSVFFGVLMSLMETLSFFYLRQYTFFTFIAFLTPFMTYGLDLGSILNAIVIVVSILLLLRYRVMKMVSYDAYA